MPSLVRCKDSEDPGAPAFRSQGYRGVYASQSQEILRLKCGDVWQRQKSPVAFGPGNVFWVAGI